MRNPRLILLAMSVLAAITACSDSTSPDDNVRIEGNVTEHDFADYTAVGFVLVDGRYHYFAMPDQVETTISYISPDGATVYGWYRPEEGADGQSFSLNLRTNAFTRITPAGLDWFVTRGANDIGQLVGLGKSRALQQTVGVLYNVNTQQVTEIRRSGYTQNGLTDINNAGVIVGYSAFGEVGFVLKNNVFTTLATAGAGRLFPTAITEDGVIVGLWGNPASWWDPADGFIAIPAGSGYSVQRYSRSAGAITSLTAANDKGALAGFYTSASTASPTVFTASSKSGSVLDHVLPGSGLEPWVNGMDNAGRVFGSILITHRPNNPDECNGHGHLHGTACHCDTGYKQDPNDEGQCILE